MKKYGFDGNILVFDDVIKEQIYLPREISRNFFGKKVKVTMVIE